MRKRARRYHRRYRRFLVCGIVTVSLVLMLCDLVIQCRPILTTFAESEAVWMATCVANETIATVLSEQSVLCSGMINVNYTEQGQLSSVIPNSTAINALRTMITDATMERLAATELLSVSIPAATMLGSEWFSGWGPMVTFPISYTATVLSDVSSSFEAVGMNQSAYRVLIHLDISLVVVSPGGRSTVGTEISYPMVEAVLLGEVPDNLTEVYGDDQSILGKIFDYGTAE